MPTPKSWSTGFGRATDLSEFKDPYIDPETGALRNLLGAQTKAALSKAEGDLVFVRMLQLMDKATVNHSVDLDELCAIHQHLFQDVYDWAGRVRTVDIRKSSGKAEFFMPASMIERGSVFAFDELHKDGMLQGMNRTDFIERLAYHYDQVNYLHPFREGNGRTQRVFWDRVALETGWQLDWRSARGEDNDRACQVASEYRDLRLLIQMFDRIVSKR